MSKAVTTIDLGIGPGFPIPPMRLEEGDRVEVVKGYWKGDKGTVRVVRVAGWPPLVVALDIDVQDAFSPEDLRRLTDLELLAEAGS